MNSSSASFVLVLVLSWLPCQNQQEEHSAFNWMNLNRRIPVLFTIYSWAMEIHWINNAAADYSATLQLLWLWFCWINNLRQHILIPCKLLMLRRCWLDGGGCWWTGETNSMDNLGMRCGVSGESHLHLSSVIKLKFNSHVIPFTKQPAPPLSSCLVHRRPPSNIIIGTIYFMRL